MLSCSSHFVHPFLECGLLFAKCKRKYLLNQHFVSSTCQYVGIWAYEVGLKHKDILYETEQMRSNLNLNIIRVPVRI